MGARMPAWICTYSKDVVMSAINWNEITNRAYAFVKEHEDMSSERSEWLFGLYPQLVGAEKTKK